MKAWVARARGEQMPEGRLIHAKIDGGQSSLRDLVVDETKTQDFILGYWQPSLRD